MFGETGEDTILLEQMANHARDFMNFKAWCNGIEAQYFGYGVGGVVAVFLFAISPSREDIDKDLWVIVGDIPSAYIVAEENPTPSSALDAYIGEMSAWVEDAESGKSVTELIPVNVPANAENAGKLRIRLDVLRDTVLPMMHDLERQD